AGDRSQYRHAGDRPQYGPAAGAICRWHRSGRWLGRSWSGPAGRCRQIYAIDPATGQPMQGLQPIQGQSANPPIQTGTMTDPATGMQYDSTTGQPLTNGADPTWG